MIIDTRMIRDELDVLYMALEELDGMADHHVVSEAGVDFHGRAKPFYLSEEIGSKNNRFWRWKDRLTVVTSDTLPEHPNPWVREHAQRDAMMPVLRNMCAPTDTVLICDIDEIPTWPDVFNVNGRPIGLHMRTTHSAVDWLWPGGAPGSVLAPWSAIEGASLSTVRDGRPNYQVVNSSGWHFSWLGGPEKQHDKANVTCHLELSPEEFMILFSGQGYRDGHHVGVDMVPVDVDETWPAFIYERRCPDSWFRPR